MLSALSLKNLKSWSKIADMRLAPITGLFGTNSSGKTSLLQLLLMLKQTVESPDRGQVLHFGDQRTAALLGTFRDVVHEHNSKQPLEWTITWKLPNVLTVLNPEKINESLFEGRELTFEGEIREDKSGRLFVEHMDYGLGANRFGMARTGANNYELVTDAKDFSFQRARGRPWPLPAPVKFYGFSDQVRAYYQNAGFLSDFELALELFFSNLYYLGPLRQYPQREYRWAGGEPADMGQRGEMAIDALLASRERKHKISRGRGKASFSVEEYVAFWLKELGLIHSFGVEEISKNSSIYQVWVQKQASAPRVLITDVGFGVSQILPVLVLCYYVPKGSTIILEHPEIHLHPSAQAGLADVFVDAIRIRDVQIILESHSEHLLKRLQRRIAEEKLQPEESALYFCTMKRNQSVLTRLNIDLWGNITNWPKDFFGDQFGELAAITKAEMRRRGTKSA